MRRTSIQKSTSPHHTHCPAALGLALDVGARRRPAGQRCTTMMKAAVYRSFAGPIKIEDLPKPTAPASGVVIQVMATGVCRSDWHGWKGHDSDIIDHGLPFVPGHEVSGVVVEVGSDVTKFKHLSSLADSAPCVLHTIGLRFVRNKSSRGLPCLVVTQSI